MNLPKLNRKPNFKRILIQCVALLFVVYALADITVLQAYCGNEAVGIPPSHHLSNDDHDSAEDLHNNFQDSHKNEHHEDSDESYHEHLSFCSSNIIFQIFVFEYSPLIYTEINTQNLISYENKHSNSNLKNLFRPPRNA